MQMNPGDPLTKLSARSWNRHELAAEYILRRKQMGDPTQRQRDYPDSNYVMVKNLAGVGLPRGAVLELGDMIVTETPMNHLWFQGNEPDGTRPFAILRRALPANKIDEAQLSGVIIARVNVTDITHTHAEVSATNTVLQSATSGPVQLLSPAAGVAEQDMAVLLGVEPGAGTPILEGITTTVLLQGSSCSVDEVQLNGSDVLVYTGDTYTVWDTTLNIGESIPSGVKIKFWESGTHWVWLAAYCAITDTAPA